MKVWEKTEFGQWPYYPFYFDITNSPQVHISITKCEYDDIILCIISVYINERTVCTACAGVYNASCNLHLLYHILSIKLLCPSILWYCSTILTKSKGEYCISIWCGIKYWYSIRLWKWNKIIKAHQWCFFMILIHFLYPPCPQIWCQEHNDCRCEQLASLTIFSAECHFEMAHSSRLSHNQFHQHHDTILFISTEPKREDRHFLMSDSH